MHACATACGTRQLCEFWATFGRRRGLFVDEGREQTHQTLKVAYHESSWWRKICQVSSSTPASHRQTSTYHQITSYASYRGSTI